VEKYQYNTLADHCGEFMSANFTALHESGRSMGLSLAIWEGMLKSDNITVPSEQVVFDAMLKYANQFDPEKRDRILTALMPLIRWTFLPVKFILDDVEKNQAFSNIQVLPELLHETYKHMSVGSNKYLSKVNGTPRAGFQRIFKERCSQQIEISADGLEGGITQSLGIWAAIVVQAPFSRHLKYCEWKVTLGPGSTGIGLTAGKIMDNQGSLNSINNSVLYYNGQVWYQGNPQGPYARAFSVNDKVGIYVDIDHDKVRFYLNGSKMLESNLPTNFNGEKLFYPVIYSCSGGSKFQLQPYAVPPE